MSNKVSIKQLGADLDSIVEAVEDERYFYQALTFVRAAAQGLARGGESGHLKQSIEATVEQTADGLVGHVGSDSDYAMYVEFGTGPRGEAHHENTSPDFEVTYTTAPWYVHESMLDTNDAEAMAQRYHWLKITNDGGTFYRINGSAAHPFLYPALKDNEDVVVNILRGGWERAIRRTTK